MITIFNGLQFRDKKELKEFLQSVSTADAINILLRAVVHAQQRGAYTTTESRVIDEVIDIIQELDQPQNQTKDDSAKEPEPKKENVQDSPEGVSKPHESES